MAGPTYSISCCRYLRRHYGLGGGVIRSSCSRSSADCRIQTAASASRRWARLRCPGHVGLDHGAIHRLCRKPFILKNHGNVTDPHHCMSEVTRTSRSVDPHFHPCLPGQPRTIAPTSSVSANSKIEFTSKSLLRRGFSPARQWRRLLSDARPIACQYPAQVGVGRQEITSFRWLSLQIGILNDNCCR